MALRRRRDTNIHHYYVTEKKALKGHDQANCYVFKTSSGKWGLCSYNTVVLLIDTDNYLECTGLYSMTTRRHIGWFLSEYFPHLNYYFVKDMAMKGYKFNLEDGDIVDCKVVDWKGATK